MTDPAITPSPGKQLNGKQLNGKQLNKVFLFAAATDIVTGLVLVALGLSAEEEVLIILGGALALAGTAVLSWLIVRTNRPEQL